MTVNTTLSLNSQELQRTLSTSSITRPPAMTRVPRPLVAAPALPAAAIPRPVDVSNQQSIQHDKIIRLPKHRSPPVQTVGSRVETVRMPSNATVTTPFVDSIKPLAPYHPPSAPEGSTAIVPAVSPPEISPTSQTATPLISQSESRFEYEKSVLKERVVIETRVTSAAPQAPYEDQVIPQSALGTTEISPVASLEPPPPHTEINGRHPKPHQTVLSQHHVAQQVRAAYSETPPPGHRSSAQRISYSA